MNAKISILIILCVFISIPAIADHRNEDNVCFYSKDNYSEKEDGTKFCVPYYTEDEWLFSMIYSAKDVANKTGRGPLQIADLKQFDDPYPVIYTKKR